MFRFVAKKSPQTRSFATLLLAEHFEGALQPSLGSTLKAAQVLGDPDVDVLVHGSAASVQAQVAEVSKYPGLRKIVTATDDTLENPYG